MVRSVAWVRGRQDLAVAVSVALGVSASVSLSVSLGVCAGVRVEGVAPGGQVAARRLVVHDARPYRPSLLLQPPSIRVRESIEATGPAAAEVAMASLGGRCLETSREEEEAVCVRRGR